MTLPPSLSQTRPESLIAVGQIDHLKMQPGGLLRKASLTWQLGPRLDDPGRPAELCIPVQQLEI